MAEPGDAPAETGGRREGRRARRPVGLDQIFDTLQTTTAEAAKTLTNSLGLGFVLIPAGSFEMGSPAAEPGHRTNEGPTHEVVIGKPFYLAARVVTQRDFLTVTGHNPSKFGPGNGGGPEHPVEMVSWDDAVAFCRLLSDRPEERAAGRSYRLPTEAEWEYACRAGKAGTPFGHGAALSPEHANFDAAHPYGDVRPGASVGHTTPVGRYPANAWGLHEMHGNVWEWCSDWYVEGYYRQSPTRDPGGPPAGRFRVLRGGSWRNQGTACRAAYRNALAPHQRDSATGFRVVLIPSGREA
ncbi:MAG TPA: formylglycine-generating enzyme family protein [Gemmataceae bacterium]|nr:formylglycine-generating enzyme family protein [Gemmataceae bacterium]